jgi:hypothetical protein
MQVAGHRPAASLLNVSFSSTSCAIPCKMALRRSDDATRNYVAIDKAALLLAWRTGFGPMREHLIMSLLISQSAWLLCRLHAGEVGTARCITGIAASSGFQ